jgi:hypothetical protein
VAYHQMGDFELQQETCARAGVTGRIIVISKVQRSTTALADNRVVGCAGLHPGAA